MDRGAFLAVGSILTLAGVLVLRPAPAPAASIELTPVVGVPGGAAEVLVVLRHDNERIAGLQVDLIPDAGISVPARANGKPECESLCREDYPPPDALTVAGGAKKSCTSRAVAFLPIRCTPGVDCIGVRLLELSLDNIDPLPTVGTIFRCALAIGADTAPGTYDMACDNPGTSNTDGIRVDTSCDDGVIDVVCRGDCDGDGEVTIAELVFGIRVAQGAAALSACPMLDADDNGTVAISELVKSRISLLSGCQQ